MEEKSIASHHELDLDLIKEFGYLSNTEINLSEKEFVTDEKIKQIHTFTTKLFDAMSVKFQSRR